MKLLELHITGFGKFHDRSINFEDGLNIIYGHNEAGKSTLHTFIRAMLFGLERGRGRASKGDLYSRFEPWESKQGYGGRLRLEQDGTVYRIERSFSKENKKYTVENETLGKEEVPNAALMDQLLHGLSETTYNNTISIGQLKSATDAGMVAELRNFIANMNNSGSMALNITKATDFLKNQRKELEKQMVPEAARNYTSLLGEIRNIEKEISAPEYANQLNNFRDMKQKVRREIEARQAEREALYQKISKGNQVLTANQFTDEASIASYRDETQKIYDEYQMTQESSGRKSGLVMMILAFLAGVVFAGVAGIGYLYRTGVISLVVQGTLGNLTKETGFIGLFALAGIICLILGLALLFHRRSEKRKYAYSEKLLQEIFSRHLGDPSVTSDAMSAFLARMQEFIRLTQVLSKSEENLGRQAQEITSLQTSEERCEQEIEKQQRSQWELEKKLEHLGNCKEQVEALKHVLAENDRIREEIAAIDLAFDTMTELSSSIRDSFGLYLNKEASDLISGITGGIYKSMSVDENLNVFMNTSTKLVPLEQVSSGTMDQVYLALRLAAAKLVQNGENQMPLIFDDSFVLYDDDRLRTALKWLAKSYQGQIIIFTCHMREAQMLTACQVEYHLIEMS